MRVNVHTPSHQIVGGVALDAGAYSVVWQSEDGQDGDEEGVYARRYRSEGGTPPPTPQPPDPPPGGPPPSPPTTDPPPLPAFSKIVQLPSNRRCVSRRRFRIRIRERGGIDIARATVKVNGKRVATRRGRRVTAPIDLRGLPKGRYRVQITIVTTDGRTLTGTRRYRTCTPKRRSRRPPKI
jgi:methionine-rich copper-binding protein CopC